MEETNYTSSATQNITPPPVYWCSSNFSESFALLRACGPRLQDGVRIYTGIIIIMGITLNLASLMALRQMTVKPACKFLAACMVIYDSLYLLGAFFSYIFSYYIWSAGFRLIESTAYLYVRTVSYYCLHRVAAPMSYWSAGILTIQR